MNFSLFHHPSGDRPLMAITLLIVGVFALACQDSLVKFLTSETSFWQFQTLRSICNVGFLLFLAGISGGFMLLRPVKWMAVYLRAGFLMVCMFFFFSGAPFLSLAQMAAGIYTYPIFVSMLAAPILGEHVGGWRVAAILLGVTGAAIVLSPWQADFSSVQCLPVIAGFFYACNILTLRRSCRTESPLALAFAVGLVFILSGLAGTALLSVYPLDINLQQSMPFIAIGWPQLSWLIVGFAVLASILNLTGNICMSRAYQTADASLLAPLDFVYLLFAAIWGKLLFDQWPSSEALAGMILIAAAGIITAWREQRASRTRYKVSDQPSTSP